jgi:lipopolysaccharide heptosyltransferase II
VNKANIIKCIDSIVGKSIIAFGKYLSLRNTININKILVIRPGGIGDAVLLIPVIHALKAVYPHAVIEILAEKRNAAVFTLCSCHAHLFHYDKPGELLAAIQGNYDVVIDTEQWHRLSALTARLTRAPILIGYATNERKRMFNYPILYSHKEYEIYSFYNLLAPLGIPAPERIFTPFLTVPESAKQRVQLLLGDLSAKQFVSIFPGASISERRWGSDRFRMVTERLYAQGIPVVVVGGKDDVSGGDRIIAGTYGLNLAGKTSLTETAAVIEKSLILVSGDTGILHVAVGLGKPTVSLFGPGMAQKWAPHGDRHIVINKGLHCSPCTKFGYTPKCPVKAKCMSDITADEVAAALELLLEKKNNP